MNRAIAGLCLAAATMTLAGCYESKVPLAPSDKSTIDSRLLGCWKSAGGKHDEVWNLIVLKYSDREYLVSWAEDGKDSEAIVTRAYSSRVGDAHIMNVQNIMDEEDDQRTFIFFRYSFSKDGRLIVRPISEKPLLEDREFESSEKFRELVAKNIDNKKLYMEETVEFTRCKEELEIRLSPSAK
ncbi:MAG: hypothetical protein HQ581_20885 [Planctomycetes bacterium]|nr:hypothetical protein [Planctomycetota bacterium]